MPLPVNPTLDLLLGRKSVRDYEDRPVPSEAKEAVLSAAMRAPTAGNMMLYQIIEVEDPARREALSHSCDEQPFIAKAPWILVFVADYQRWYDYFLHSGVAEMPGRGGRALPRPAEADLLLASCDALVAAQTAVVACDSLGLGSCYIGDVMERIEEHREFFGLPELAFPVAMLAIGWPTPRQRERPQPGRFPREFIVAKERYRRAGPGDFPSLFGKDPMEGRPFLPGASNHGQHVWLRKFDTDFMEEMRRSVRVALEAFRK